MDPCPRQVFAAVLAVALVLGGASFGAAAEADVIFAWGFPVFAHDFSPYVSSSCFEIVKGMQYFFYMHGFFNYIQHLLHSPVGEGSFIQCVPADAGGIDAFHRGLEGGNGIVVLYVLPLVNPSGAVGRGAVKLLIAEASAQKNAVMHVDGDDHSFPLQGGDCPFAK